MSSKKLLATLAKLEFCLSPGPLLKDRRTTARAAQPFACFFGSEARGAGKWAGRNLALRRAFPLQLAINFALRPAHLARQAFQRFLFIDSVFSLQTRNAIGDFL